jgi:hypothetical protein
MSNWTASRSGEATLAVTTSIIGKTLPYFGVIGQAFFPISSFLNRRHGGVTDRAGYQAGRGA